MAYYRLDEALAICNDNQHVLACDTTKGNGMVGKKFFVCPNLWTPEGDSHFKRLVRENGPHFYEILQPDRPTHIFMDIETTNGVYDRVKAGVEVLCKMIRMWMEHMEINMNVVQVVSVYKWLINKLWEPHLWVVDVQLMILIILCGNVM